MKGDHTTMRFYSLLRIPDTILHKPAGHTPGKSKGFVIGIILLMLLGSACNMPSISARRSSTQPTPTEPAAPRPEISKTEISFRVTVPANTPASDIVYLSILDEVTGLALNTENYSMKPSESKPGERRIYTLSLPLSLGTAVLYRYERRGTNTAVVEHISDGRPVRYRIYHVEGPGSVEDVVSRWTDTSFDVPHGRIMGQTVDAATEQPVANILVTAGGAQTLTKSDGTFLIEGLPEGIHNLVVYALDGSYRTFQQGARVAANSTTPAPIKVKVATPVEVTFIVSLPKDVPPVVPVRLAGNLYQLGNTFANLAGGTNALAVNMPVLTPLPDGRFQLTLTLPAGADIRYKYTLGDGFWNAEHDKQGKFVQRQIIVPEDGLLLEDEVDSWRAGDQGSVTFDVAVPPETPTQDIISIQFNPIFGWTEPIPMWSLGNNRWAYVLYSPLNLPGKLAYRFCRNSQCSSADDDATLGEQSAGYTVSIGQEPQTIKTQVNHWAWLDAKSPRINPPQVEIKPKGKDFVAGVEFRTAYHPSWKAYLTNSLNDVKRIGANWLILTPTWTFTRNSPPILEPVAGSDELWLDIQEGVTQGQAVGLNVTLFPRPRFPTSIKVWWKESQRDFSWWLVWFDHYRLFALHHADLAARTKASALILGGDWLGPALPNGALADGTPSGVPADSEARFRNLIAEVRSHYSGKLLWAIPYRDLEYLPVFLDALDGIYLTWSIRLSSDPSAPESVLEAEASRLLDEIVQPVQALTNKPLFLSIEYPSADGGVTGCVRDTGPSRWEGSCIGRDLLAPPYGTIPPVKLDLQEQLDVYNALLSAINQRAWISGFVTRGYYPPAALQDPSSSVHGKPAEELLAFWFPKFLVAP